MKSERFITKTGQYALVHSRGKSRAGSLVVMRVLPNGLGISRYGFVVSKRVGKAVVRNRVKRWLREIMRQAPLKPGWDIVFIARPKAAAAGFTNLKNLIMGLLAQARLLMENYEKVSLGSN